MKSLCALLLALASFAASPAKADEPRKTRNVIVVTLDGFRWQEFFGGAQDGFIDKEAGGVREVADLRRRYVRKSLEESREVSRLTTVPTACPSEQGPSAPTSIASVGVG